MSIKKSDIDNNFLARLKLIRKNSKLSQAEFAKSIGISQPQYCAIETGKSKLTETQIIAIETRYKISLSWLKDGTGEMFAAEPSPTYESEKNNGPIDITTLAGLVPERALKILQEINELDRRVKEAGYTEEELRFIEAGLRDLIRKRRGL